MYPHASEAEVAGQYTEYMSNLQNYYYERQYDLNDSSPNSIITPTVPADSKLHSLLAALQEETKEE